MSRQIVINFHGIGAPPAAIEDDERPYWVDIDMFTKIVERAAPRPEVSFTFDDGNRSDLEQAAPLLARLGRTGEFFVLTGRLDRAGYLTPADLHALRDMGMGIGLHGRDHVDWRRLDEAALAAETIEARNTLSQAAGCPIDTVSVPFGAYNRSLIKHLFSCGYAAINTSDGGTTDTTASIRNRTSVRCDMSPETIDAIIAGRSAPAAALRRTLSTFARRHLV
jgi:peptidoglycan/xylan/chitin deacetylase (PgdA/CDA1 family)